MALPEPITDWGVDGPDREWTIGLEGALKGATWAAGLDNVSSSLYTAVPRTIAEKITKGATAIFHKEPTIVELKAGAVGPEQNTVQLLEGCKVIVVGDTHGQFHDVCRMFKLHGHPSQDLVYIFNGDFVDRGAWGVETLLLLLAWKLTLPNRFFMIRGNHESTNCTQNYGFLVELMAKYGRDPEVQPAQLGNPRAKVTDPRVKPAKQLYTLLRRMFAEMPLAALVADTTLILHGGLFRKPSKGKRRRKSKSGSDTLQVGTLADLRAASKGGQDPDGESAASVVAADVLWSDPVLEPGMHLNTGRMIGTVFGPDVTEEFLSTNNLKLILRSHEGPDARDKREDMQGMDKGYTLDHQTPSGLLATVFSAPDYPQFQTVPDKERYKNLGAVAVLTAPTYNTPEFTTFEADVPRPPANCYYDITYSFLSDDEEDAEASETAAGGAAGSQEEAESGGKDGSSPRRALRSSHSKDAAATVAEAATASRDTSGAVAAVAAAGEAADKEADSSNGSAKEVMAAGKAETRGTDVSAASGAGPASGVGDPAGQDQQQEVLSGAAGGDGRTSKQDEGHGATAEEMKELQPQEGGEEGHDEMEDAGDVGLAAGQKRKGSFTSREKQATSPKQAPSKRHRSAGGEGQVPAGYAEMLMGGESAAAETAQAEAVGEAEPLDPATAVAESPGTAVGPGGASSAMEVDVFLGEEAGQAGGKAPAAAAVGCSVLPMAEAELGDVAAAPAAACKDAAGQGEVCKEEADDTVSCPDASTAPAVKA